MYRPNKIIEAGHIRNEFRYIILLIIMITNYAHFGILNSPGYARKNREQCHLAASKASLHSGKNIPRSPHLDDFWKYKCIRQLFFLLLFKVGHAVNIAHSVQCNDLLRD